MQHPTLFNSPVQKRAGNCGASVGLPFGVNQHIDANAHGADGLSESQTFFDAIRHLFLDHEEVKIGIIIGSTARVRADQHHPTRRPRGGGNATRCRIDLLNTQHVTPSQSLRKWPVYRLGPPYFNAL